MLLSRMVGGCLALLLMTAAANAETPSKIRPHHPLRHSIAKSIRHRMPKKRRILVRRRVRPVPPRPLLRRTQRRLATRAASPAKTLKGALRPEIGKAAWYDLAGRLTASGEPFRATAATAAHRTLPLFSYARVTNLKNGRSVVVEINDRGPQTPRIMIDLSEGAAAKLHMRRAGVAPVRVAPLTPRETVEALALYGSDADPTTR